jgi:hypothetical protein
MSENTAESQLKGPSTFEPSNLMAPVRSLNWKLFPTPSSSKVPSKDLRPTLKYESRGFLWGYKQGYARGSEIFSFWNKKFSSYRSLAEGEVRVLELLPRSSNDFIHCRLYQGLLDRLPRYEALSYTWGDNSDPNLPIIIDDGVFLVKSNLKDALTRFCPTEREITSEDPADEFLKLWERIRLVIDRAEGAQIFESIESTELVQSFGEKGQADCEKYYSLVNERAAQNLEPSSSLTQDPGIEIKSLLSGIDLRRQELQNLWELYATSEAKSKVAFRSRFFWIDAICINQADSDERTEQIKIMRQIYRKAHSVAVWLGDDDGDGGTAIDLLHRLHQSLEKSFENGKERSSVFDEFDEATPWYSLGFFFSAPWFRRSWTVQEYIAGITGTGSLVFYYGPQCIPWQVLYDILMTTENLELVIIAKIVKSWVSHPRRYPWNGSISALDVSNPYLPRRYEVRHDIGDSCRLGLEEWSRLGTSLSWLELKESNTLQGYTSPRLLYWLMRMRDRQASNPLDKIYSFLSLIGEIYSSEEPEDVSLGNLIVDYNASVQDVYSSLVHAMVIRTRKLHILGACTARGPHIQRTWTPDWTQPREYNLYSLYMMLPSDFESEVTYIVGVSGFCSSAESDCQVVFGSGMSTLIAKGVLWDKISNRAGGFNMKESNLQQAKEVIAGNLPSGFAKSLSNILCLVENRGVYADEAARNEAFWTTLTIYWGVASGNFGLHKECPSSALWAQKFQDFLKSEEPCNEPLLFSTDISSRDLDETEGIIDTLQKAIISALCNDRAFFTTEKGYVGQGTNRCQAGDIVCVLLGCNLPIILRPVEEHYEVIGEIYIHGIMQGEAMQALERGEVHLQSFELH